MKSYEQSKHFLSTMRQLQLSEITYKVANQVIFDKLSYNFDFDADHPKVYCVLGPSGIVK